MWMEIVIWAVVNSTLNKMRIQVDIPDVNDDDKIKKYQEIIVSLIGSGAFDLKNGKAIIHFDWNSIYQGVQLEYWAYKRKSNPR